MSNLIATKRVDLLAPYLALDQGPKVMAECESLSISWLGLYGGWVDGVDTAVDRYAAGFTRCLVQ
jgi:hypothetical protein